ncbi:MAG: hypothetical protein ACREBU_17500 [Nitrososphaera sp.]
MFGKGYDREAGETATSFVKEAWYGDLQKLTHEEVIRMYTVIADGRYTFARNAWYVPIGGDQRCPIMVAKGFRSPDTLDRMVEFQDTAKLLETEFRSFIDAWDFGHITMRDIEKAILEILEERNIAVAERSPVGG